MTIQDWGALGEIIGAIAVVASLVYLAIQIRQNTNQIAQGIETERLAAFERNVEAGNRIRELMIVNPDVADLVVRGSRDYQELSGTDKMRYELLMSNVFSGMQGAYVRHLSLGSDPQGFAGSLRKLDAYLVRPGVRAWLDQAEPDWRPEFSVLVKERLEATKNPG